MRAEKEGLIVIKQNLEKEYQSLLIEEKTLRSQEAEIRKSDADIEKDNKIIQHKLKEVQDERKSLVEIQEQLDHENNLMKPLMESAFFAMENLRYSQKSVS